MSTDAFAPAAFPRLGGPDHRAEQERARRRGYADGHAEGYRAGAAQAEAEARAAEEHRTRREASRAHETATAVAALHAAATSLTAREQELAAVAHEQVLRHAIELAELILAAELSDHGASAAAALRRVLAVPEAAGARTVRVHPDDLRVLEHDPAATGHGFTLVADATLDRGDAVAVPEHGVIDARVSAALDRARRVLDGSAT